MSNSTPDRSPLRVSCERASEISPAGVSCSPKHDGNGGHPVRSAVGWGVPGSKRFIDILGALFFLVVNAPLFLVIPIFIKLDSRGPVIYTQARVGLNRRRRLRRIHSIAVTIDLRRADRRQNRGEGRLFLIYKFRTMRADAEHDGPQWAEKDDPRVTRVGRILRATHLDELPQLWNVLRGEMSLVGPRPERPHFVSRFAHQIPSYRHRLLAPPGITGLAQVEFRYDCSEEDVRRKLVYDLDYIQKYSLARDLRILLKTVIVIVTGKAGY